MKRCFDLLFSALLLLMLWPLLLLLAIFVRINFGTPIFFCQKRPGLKGNLFTLYKYRTMRNIHDKKGLPLADEERLTNFGRFLRSSSLDELPELVNVLKGEMSLIGPRPLLVQYLERYSPEQFRRHEVRPGITGWAQINGRNTISWQEKFELDVWYVDNHTFWLDITILFSTIWKSLKREGISEDGRATASEFMGNKPSEAVREKNI